MDKIKGDDFAALLAALSKSSVEQPQAPAPPPTPWMQTPYPTPQQQYMPYPYYPQIQSNWVPPPAPPELPPQIPDKKTIPWVAIGVVAVLCIAGVYIWFKSMKMKEDDPEVEEEVVAAPAAAAPKVEEQDDVAKYVSHGLFRYLQNPKEVFDLSGIDLPEEDAVPKRTLPSAPKTRISDESDEVDAYAAKRASLFPEETT